jgi:hypothetical protein
VQNERGHAAIVARFDGPCTRPTLFADTHFMLIDQREGGPYYDQTLENITNLAGFPRRGCYTNPSVTYVDRLRILAAAKALIPRAPIAYGFDDAVGPVNWNGHLDTITALRCDSIVEVCYEINGINVWAMFRAAARGGDDTYNYSIADQADQWSYNDTTGTWTHQANQMPDNLEEHNDYDQLGDWDDTFMPATQAGYVAPENARTQFARQNLCVPIGSTGGN